MNKSICFYFEVHQPYRLSKRNVFEVGGEKNYFEGPPAYSNRSVFEKVARKCYLPMNALVLELLNTHPEFRVSYSLSGVFLEQCLEYGDIGRQVLDSFKKIFATGQAEILSETYYHSLSWLFSKDEFAKQIIQHDELVQRLFRKKPTIFRNTELIYSNEIAAFIKQMGFRGILAEGWDHYLEWRSPNLLHRPKSVELHPEDEKIASRYRVRKTLPGNFSLLLKNYKLSDDIAFRFSNRGWNEWPLTTDKYMTWLDAAEGDTVNLFMDYETFGEHQWEDTGIFEFMRHLPQAARSRGIGFKTPSESIRAYEPVGEVDVPHLMSWADMERDLSAWRSNPLQESALQRVFEIERTLKENPQAIGDDLLHDWRKLQTSDHFYYMCTKYWSDGDVHAYFSPFDSPYEAFINYMNTLSDFEKRVADRLSQAPSFKEGLAGAVRRAIDGLKLNLSPPVLATAEG